MTVKQMLDDEQMLNYFRTLENEAMSCIDEDMDLEELDVNEVFHIGYAMGKLNYDVSKRLIQAKELLRWALHSDPEHDDLVDFDTKWNEAEQFLKED